MQKKIISEELYFCLEKLVELKGREWLIKTHAAKKYSNWTGWLTEKYEILNDLSLDDLADLLYNGYRLEEKKEDKLIRFYNTRLSDRSSYSLREERAYKLGIIDCYEILEGESFPFE